MNRQSPQESAAHPFRLASLGLLVVTLLFARPSAAQDLEYGDPSEMRGLTKLHIDAGADIDLFRLMRAVIAKRAPAITIVPERESEFALVFTYVVRRSAQGRSYYVGELHALKTSGEPLRLLSVYRHDEDELDDLADEIVKQFTKEYSRINK